MHAHCKLSARIFGYSQVRLFSIEYISLVQYPCLPNELLYFFFSAERRKYYKHTEKAKRHPSRYLSIIIDGMDQSKTFVPHFVRVSKSVSSLWKLKTHITGAIVHGRGAYGFFDNHEWPHSSNLTITVLLNLLSMYRESLPPVLYLQLDNCEREKICLWVSVPTGGDGNLWQDKSELPYGWPHPWGYWSTFLPLLNVANGTPSNYSIETAGWIWEVLFTFSKCSSFGESIQCE